MGRHNRKPHEFLCGELYSKCLAVDQNKQWFGFWDCLERLSLTVLYWYFAAITSPINFLSYTHKYCQLWYGRYLGLFLTVLFPILPWALIALEIAKKVNNCMPWAKDDLWTAGPGAVFFTQPRGFLGSLLWASYLNISMYAGLYLACGNDADAVACTFYDGHLVNKDFWRDVMGRHKMRVPRQIGRWDGAALKLDCKLDCDIVLKLTDSYLGIGDKFLGHGKDFSTAADLETILQTGTYKGNTGDEDWYVGKEVLVLELVRPHTSLGVHSYDILTMITDDGAKVLSCLFWGDCQNDSSHSCTSGYAIDVETETFHSVVKCYSAGLALSTSDDRIGTKTTGVADACRQACEAHDHAYATQKQRGHPFLKMVGWDAMLMPNDEVVFFEGNFGAARLPRRMFLSPGILLCFVRDYFWPFGKAARDLRPKAQ
jgi:hypothetical protein